MAIHQLVAGAAPGDAVTNTAFDLRRLLLRIGPSEVIARYIDPKLADGVVPIAQYAERRGHRDDVIVYHASIGEPDIVAFLLDRPEKLVLLYHNITPAGYFHTIDPAFAQLLAIGRVELEMLRERVALALAVSAYNASELEALGYRDVRVSPLPLELGSLPLVEPDPAFVELLNEAHPEPLVLFVGQLLPHKRPDLLIQAHHMLSTYLLPEAELVLVGPTRQPAYRSALEQLIGDLNLRVWITGWLSDERLVALYRKAACFATMSEHEGVCVPVLEAMAFDVPVVARRFAAIPETVGEAGLLLPPEEDRALAADAVWRLVEDAALRSELITRGRRRVAAVDPDVNRAVFLSHLAEVL